MVRALILIGAPGAGKSSVLEALTTLLELEHASYGAIESEQLGWGSPPLATADRIEQLTAVLSLQRRAGRRRFLIAATVESAGELAALRRAPAAGRVLVVCLSAPAALVAKRIAERESDRWPGKAPLIAHARRLAVSTPNFAGIDVVLDTEESAVEELAAEVLGQMRARGFLDDARS